jgi:hypothetical protein
MQSELSLMAYVDEAFEAPHRPHRRRIKQFPVLMTTRRI